MLHGLPADFRILTYNIPILNYFKHKYLLTTIHAVGDIKAWVFGHDAELSRALVHSILLSPSMKPMTNISPVPVFFKDLFLQEMP